MVLLSVDDIFHLMPCQSPGLMAVHVQIPLLMALNRHVHDKLVLGPFRNQPPLAGRPDSDGWHLTRALKRVGELASFN